MTEAWGPDDDEPRPHHGPVKVRVPAKINLHLAVGPLRPDGYHELNTVYHAISLFDELTARRGDPLTLTMEGEGTGELALDETNLIIRAAFKQRNGEDIPQQVVTVPLAYRIEGNDIVIDRGTVIVAPADEPPSAAEQIARAGIIRKKLESSIPEQRRSRIINLKRENNEDFAVVINRIVPLNGWVTVWGQ